MAAAWQALTYLSDGQANQLGAILFFFPFVIMQVFVFLNMVIAIILDGYTNMKRDRQRMAESWLKDLVCSPPRPILCARILDLLPFPDG